MKYQLLTLMAAVERITGENADQVLTLQTGIPHRKSTMLLAAYLRHCRGKQWREIARILGRKSHSSVIDVVKIFDNLPVEEQLSLLEEIWVTIQQIEREPYVRGPDPKV